MKKKILTFILVILMIAPAIAALASFIMSTKGAIDTSVVTELNLTDPLGRVFTFTKDEPSGIRGNTIAFLSDLNKNASEIAEVPEQVRSLDHFTAEYVSYDKTATYEYYFISYDDDAFYSDSDGKSYRIAEEYAKEFMRSQYCAAIFPSSAAPKLLFPSERSVTPLKLDWQYLVSATVYSDENHYETKKEDIYYDLVEGMSFGFDIEPGTSKATIKQSGSDTEVYSGDFLRFDFSLLTVNNTYDVAVSAEWFETSERGSSGAAEYEFAVKVIPAPTFAISSTNIQSYGGFVQLAASGVSEGREVKIKTEPDIGVSPAFVKDGDIMRAFVPLSFMLDSIPDTFDLTVSMEGYAATYHMNVNKVELDPEQRTLPDDVISGVGTQDKYNEAYNTLGNAAYFGANTERKFAFDTPFTWPVDIASGVGYVDSTFGVPRSVTGSFDRVHRGIDFGAPDGTDIACCADGVIAYVGETEYTGKTVIIDHGMGLRSTYAHLSECTTLAVGTEIKAGDFVGKAGSTGAAMLSGVHFELTIGAVPVSPVPCLYNGIADLKVEG